ncbi:SusC/RagA family TonB-linked outer membrane protein [Dyadobacter fanqingshengii]|uniref:TonB-dependent receptor n=1 Tax=Dyadobacter fanqingshengii TaxID=2906443 RepID=A0A9X1PDK3_9BACT|nr:TonB-dependent receptor [Dyadobacter fanqingshengii]MCF0041738.1 TonB-dependent receptor [Dyadobacter fanqingshengii]MCF2505037.1 TonB-dependent receptor [Dyadobacter fanqingshengii]USJ36548.1 TonB-dependent receptor [Dyadobacter fanqingshengii]
MGISKPERDRGLSRYFFSLFLTFIVTAAAFAQDVTVKGKVNDEQSQGLPGVSVVVKGTSTGTVTDLEGNYTVNAPGTSTLVFSFIGYITQEIPLGNKTSLDVKLLTDTKALEEVVVVGYGTAKKATLTGSVTAVKGGELAKAPATNLSNTLSGRLPGVSAVQGSGEPGYDGSAIRIRGTNSLGNSNALIVVDGVPNRSGGLDRLNPADIESVSVLKDAAAAIYGSRAGNGVILITTKRGKTGKPQLSYDFNMGMAQPTRTPTMSNATQYATIRNELQIYDNLAVGEWDGALQGFNTNGAYTRKDNGNVLNAVFTPDDIQKFTDGSDPLIHPNTDWYDSVIRNWSPQQRHNLQLTGGSENIKYLASLGHINQEGNYVNSATGYKQYDMRINLDTKINKYVSANLGLTLREEFRRFPNGGGAGDIFRMLMRGKPTEIAIWPDGRPGPDIENGQNPAVITTNTTGYNHDKRDYIQTNGSIEILIPGVEGLKVNAMAAIDKQIRRQKSFQKPWTLYFWDKKTYEADGTSPFLTGTVRSTFSDPRLTETSSQELSIQLTGQVSYEKSVGSHNFNVMAGIQREKVDADGFFAYRRYFISPVVDQLFAGGTPEQNIGNSGTATVNGQTINNTDLFSRARLSYFGRAGYNFKEKYLAEFLWRVDGSYVFPQDGRFGFFPGVSAGWRISEEDFWKGNINFMNNVKIRGSWGQMGAEPYLLGTETLAEYQYLSTMGFGSYVINDQVAKTLLESRVANKAFTWEVANNMNFGIEGTLFRDKVAFEFDYFVNNRSNILIPKTGSTPSSAGIDGKLPPQNLGKLQNKGWEFKVSYDGSADNFTYSVSVNGGYAKNQIKYWDETPGAPAYQQTTGMPYNSFLAYQYDGVFRDQGEVDSNPLDYSGITGSIRPGDMKFKDVNNDGRITADDKVRSEKTNRPQFTGGAAINLGYKAFDLSILFQGALGGLQYIGQTESGDIGNYLQYAYDNRWTIDNPSSTEPRLANRNNTYYTNFDNAGANTYFLRSNNYLRLKNIELGYNLPSEIGSKIGLGNLRVYVNGLNLFTFDKIKIWDPESTSSNGQYYPQSRVLNAGVRVTF